MYTIFDTETSGLPLDWHAPESDLDNWPRLIQLAWVNYSEDGRKIAEHSYLVRPEGFTISDEVADITRITTKRAMEDGFPLGFVLKAFHLALTQTSALVAHNIAFDLSVMGSEFLRAGMIPAHGRLYATPRVCTMKTTTDFVGIQNGRGGNKWPKLIELHEKLFKEGISGAHDASVDVNALTRCFFELKKLKIIEV